MRQNRIINFVSQPDKVQDMNKKKHPVNLKERGFTLMELLVVIGIIGILAAIALANLSEARKKAKDAAIKSALKQSVDIAENFYYDTGDYDLVCDEPQFVSGGVIRDSITENGGSFSCGDAPDGYCFSSTLNEGGSACIDGSGELKYGFECDATGNDTACD